MCDWAHGKCWLENDKIKVRVDQIFLFECLFVYYMRLHMFIHNNTIHTHTHKAGMSFERKRFTITCKKCAQSETSAVERNILGLIAQTNYSFNWLMTNSIYSVINYITSRANDPGVWWKFNVDIFVTNRWLKFRILECILYYSSRTCSEWLDTVASALFIL